MDIEIIVERKIKKFTFEKSNLLGYIMFLEKKNENVYELQQLIMISYNNKSIVEFQVNYIVILNTSNSNSSQRKLLTTV